MNNKELTNMSYVLLFGILAVGVALLWWVDSIEKDLDLNYYTVEQSDSIDKARLEAWDSLFEQYNKTTEKANNAFVMARMSLWYNGAEFVTNIGVESWQSLPEFPNCLFENMGDTERLQSIDTFEPTILTYRVDRGNTTYFTSITKANLRCAYLSEETGYLTLPMECEDICLKS